MPNQLTHPSDPAQPARRRTTDYGSLALFVWVVAVAILYARTMLSTRGEVVFRWIRQLFMN
jgi:hypothetical protein